MTTPAKRITHFQILTVFVIGAGSHHPGMRSRRRHARSVAWRVLVDARVAVDGFEPAAVDGAALPASALGGLLLLTRSLALELVEGGALPTRHGVS
jgi:hypothetical protein